MNLHPDVWSLGRKLFSLDELQQIRDICEGGQINIGRLADFDAGLGPPRLMDFEDAALVKRYVGGAREVFRPLQYCQAYFGMQDEWVNRAIVEMSCAHLEALVKRIAGAPRVPLGSALRQALAKRRIPEATGQLVDAARQIYNEAKHDFDHELDTHRFSREDSVVVFFSARRLGSLLYSLAGVEGFLAPRGVGGKASNPLGAERKTGTITCDPELLTELSFSSLSSVSPLWLNHL